ATRAARESVQPSIDAAEAARKSAAMATEDKLREALAAVHNTAERVARQTVDSARATMEDASRRILDEARAGLQDTARLAAEAAAKPIAETSARSVAEHLVRVTLAGVQEEETAMRADVEQASIGVAEKVTRELIQPAIEAAETARREAIAAAETKLAESLATVHATA